MTRRSSRRTPTPTNRRTFPKPPPAVPLPTRVKATGPIRFLAKKEVLSLLGVTNVTLWSMIQRGDFPAGRQLGPDGGRHSKIAWIDSEVYDAIANTPRRIPRGGRVPEEA